MSDNITLTGTVTEVGSDDGKNYDIALAIPDGRTVRIYGLTFAEGRDAAKHLYEQVTINVTCVR